MSHSRNVLTFPSRRVLVPVALTFLALFVYVNAPLAAHAQGSPSSPTSNSDDFVITVKTDNPGSSTGTQFTIPTTGSGYNYNVDCDNNGVNEATAQTGDYTCSYGSAGTYTVRIKDNSGAGTGFPRIYFNSGGDAQKLLTIEQWGTGKWDSMYSAFAGCSNLAGQATDSPDLSGVSDMGAMFAGDTAFNQNISTWNTANVTSMNDMFRSASSFNQNIGSWNTANVIFMGAMFYGASAFNQNIGSWNTANVINMGAMFQSASAFNQNLNSWNTANVTTMQLMFRDATAFNGNIASWNTASVNDMSLMFLGASAFNQNIGSWNTANVTNMTFMFYNDSAFNQNIGSWNTAKVTNMNDMFDGDSAFDQNLGGWDVGALTTASGMFSNGNLSTANYDALLIGWDAQTLLSNGFLGAGNTKYCAGETARSHMISSDLWTINDGGKGCPSTDLRITEKAKKVSATKHRYKLTVTNLGAVTALNVTVTDKLPKHYTITNTASSTASCGQTGRKVTCTLAQLGAGAKSVIKIVASPHGATGTNCGKVTADNPDPNHTNNKACVNVPTAMLLPNMGLALREV